MSAVPERHSLRVDLAEFRHAWRILIVATVGVAINANSSVLYAFGAMVLPLQAAFGWSRGELQFAISFLFAGAVVGTQAAGWLNLRYGMRRVTLCSLGALALGLLALTQLGASIAWLYGGLLLLPLASLGVTQVSWTQLVSLWFKHNRGLALAVVLSGTGLAAMGLPSAITWAVGHWGWQAGFVLLALLTALGALPLAACWMALPAPAPATVLPAGLAPVEAVQGRSFGQAIRHWPFWGLNVGLVLVVAAVVGLITSTVPLLRDKGLSAADAAQVFGGFGISLLIGRGVVGYLLDRLWAPGVAAVSLALPALGCLLLSQAPPSALGWLSLATALMGLGAGAEFDIAAFLVARYYGLRDYGRIFGLHLGLITAGSAVAPLLFGALYQHTGHYTAMLWVCGLSFAVGPLLLLGLGPYPRFDNATPRL